MPRPDPTKAASLSPVLAYEPERGLFLCDDHSLAFGFLCRPPAGADDSMQQRMRTFLAEEWPAGTTLAFALIASPNIRGLLDQMQELRKGHDDPVLEAMIEARARHLEQGIDRAYRETNTFVRDFVLVITAKVPIEGHVPQDSELDAVAALRARAQESLENLPSQPRPMGPQDYVTTLSVLVNRGPHAAWRPFGKVEAHGDALLCQQVFDGDTDVRADRKGFWLGQTRVSMLSVKSYPATVYFGTTALLVGDLLAGTRGLRHPFMLTTLLHYPDAQKKRAAITTSRNWNTHQVSGPLVRWMPSIALRQNDFDIMFKSLEDGHRPVQIATLLTVYTPDEATAETATANAVNYFGEQQHILLQDHFISLALFRNALPFGADRSAVATFNRYRTVSVDHATALIALFADWPGTGNPVLTFVSRNGQLMGLDIFDSSEGYNTVIAAKTGSGKSFAANFIIDAYLSIGAQIWVIDVGRSYANTCERHDGDYLDIGAEHTPSLNPFPLVADYKDEADMLESLLAAMAAPTEPLTDFQRSQLSLVLHDLWAEHRHNLTIDHVADALKAHKVDGVTDHRITDIGHQLFAFTAEGQHGRYFAGKNAISFKNRLTVLELEHLKQRPHLQRIVLLQLIYQIQQTAFFGDRARPKIVIVDEAWDLLRHGDVGAFLEGAYRRFRKYGAAAVVITQSLADLYENNVGRAIVENAAHKLLLAQSSESIDALVRDQRLALNDYGVELLKSTRTVAGRFSEILCITARGTGLARLIVSPWERLVYSTDAQDTAAIQRHRARGLNLADAIAAVLAERRQAAVA